MDVNSGAYTVLHTFSNYASISLGEGEGYLSDDDDYVALQARNGSKTALIVYDVQANVVVAEKDLGGYWPNNSAISPSGNYVFVNWAGRAGPGGSSNVETTAAPSPTSGRSPTGASTATSARTPRATTSTCSPARTCRAGASTPVRRRYCCRAAPVRREPRVVPEPRARRLGLRQHLRRPELEPRLGPGRGGQA